MRRRASQASPAAKSEDATLARLVRGAAVGAHGARLWERVDRRGPSNRLAAGLAISLRSLAVDQFGKAPAPIGALKWVLT